MFVLKPDLNKFSSFCKLPACWSHYFCRKKSLDSFSPSGRLTKWAKFGFSIFWVFYQAGCLQNEQSLPFQVFEVSKLWKPPAFVKRGVWVRGTPTRSSITDIYINVDHRSSITQFDRDRKSSIVNRKLFHNRSSIANRYFHNRSSIINRDCEKLLQKAKQKAFEPNLF